MKFLIYLSHLIFRAALLFGGLLVFAGSIQGATICDELYSGQLGLLGESCKKEATSNGSVDATKMQQCIKDETQNLLDFLKKCEEREKQGFKPETSGFFGIELTNKIEGLNKLKITDPAILIGRIIKIVMGIIGSVALLIFVFGGVMWMTARGNSEQVAKATKTLAWAALGVVVILASYAIVSFIFGAIG